MSCTNLGFTEGFFFNKIIDTVYLRFPELLQFNSYLKFQWSAWLQYYTLFGLLEVTLWSLVLGCCFFNLNVMHVVVSKLYRYTIWLFHFGYCELNWRVFYYFRVIIRDKKLTKHRMLQSKYLCIKDMFLFKTVCEH